LAYHFCLPLTSCDRLDCDILRHRLLDVFRRIGKRVTDAVHLPVTPSNPSVRAFWWRILWTHATN